MDDKWDGKHNALSWDDEQSDDDIYRDIVNDSDDRHILQELACDIWDGDMDMFYWVHGFELCGEDIGINV